MKFLIAVFKLLVIVIAMTLLYSILEQVSLVLITNLYPVEGSWLPTVSISVVYFFSILVVCFMASLLYPVDFWIVRVAALCYVFYCFIGDIYVLIRAQIKEKNMRKTCGFVLVFIVWIFIAIFPPDSRIAWLALFIRFMKICSRALGLPSTGGHSEPTCRL